MIRATETSRTKTDQSLVWGLVIGGVIVSLLSDLFRWMNTSTELTPSHDGILGVCLAISGLSGLVCAAVVVRKSRQMATVRRIVLVLVAAVGGAAAGAGSIDIADIVEGWIDFPSGSTTSYQSDLPISRAYKTHGRWPSWVIQTMPVWFNINITKSDYEFMLAHRRPADDGHDPGVISSQGYFCAHVTIEQSGNALRVMHAGGHRLPEGTVVLCPPGEK